MSLEVVSGKRVRGMEMVDDRANERRLHLDWEEVHPPVKASSS
jgi:hypothetical protein